MSLQFRRGLAWAVAALFAVEALTGLALAAYYAPSTTTAWASVWYFDSQVALGWLVRGMHRWAAHGLVIAAGVHLLAQVWSASFRDVSRVQWLVGLCVLPLALGLAHTGFLLPGDQRAFFASQILFGITSSIPLVGGAMADLLRGGPAYGSLTLTHLYAAHLLVLPALFAWAGVRHLRQVEENSILPAAIATAGVLLVFALAVWSHGAPLEAPADAARAYPGRPEWYFYPLFELRHAFEGRWEWLATLGVPGVLFWALAKGKDSRVPLAPLAGLTLTGAAALGLAPALRDRADPTFQSMRRQADADAVQARRLAELGVPAEGPAFLYKNDPVVWGERVFAQKCAGCHAAAKKGPALEGYASRAWLKAVIREPHAPAFFGPTHLDDMDNWAGTDQDLAAVTEFVYAQAGHPDTDNPLATRGARVFAEAGCSSCHGVDGHGTGLAPDLKGYASLAWVGDFLRRPAAEVFYGARNEMDAFDVRRLDDAEGAAVTAYLQRLSRAP